METVRQILRNNFNMKKVWSKMVSRLLTPEQKEIWMNICADILQTIEKTQTFRERYNLWWILVFFFNTTQKVRVNPCTGRAQFNKAKESTAEQIQI